MIPRDSPVYFYYMRFVTIYGPILFGPVLMVLSFLYTYSFNASIFMACQSL